MEKEKINQYIVVGIILSLLLMVVGFVLFSIFKKSNNSLDEPKIKLSQIYSSDYRITPLDENYFIGSYSNESVNNRINVIIDTKGTEVVKNIDEIFYDNIFRMKNGNYLIYNNIGNMLNCYVFDGESLVFLKTYENVTYAKPLIYSEDDVEYIIGFASIEDNKLNLFNLESHNKVVLENKSLVADYNEEGIYYTYNENYLVLKDNDGLMGVVDLEGNQIIDYKYKNIINTNINSFIAVSNKDKYGILDNKNNIIVKFNYDAIARFGDYYLFVKGNKMALFDKDYNNLTDFKMNYDSLLKYDFRKKVNSIELYKVSDKIVVLNNNLELNNGTEYDKHNLYLIEDNKISKNITQTGFGCDGVIYIIDKNYNLRILDDNFEIIMELEIEDLKKIEKVKLVDNDIYQITYMDQKEQIVTSFVNKNGEKVSFDYGEVLLMKDNYRFVKTETDDRSTLILYNNKYDKISELSGKNITILNDYAIVDSAIYKVVVS